MEKKKIMIVDDSPEDLNLMGGILEKEGFEVVTTDNGADALELLNGNGFDLMLIDVKMPTLSGYDLLRLSREKVNHDVKMIYVTIVPEKEVDMSNADGIIQKPFSPEKFIETIKKELS